MLLLNGKLGRGEEGIWSERDNISMSLLVACRMFSALSVDSSEYVDQIVANWLHLIIVFLSLM